MFDFVKKMHRFIFKSNQAEKNNLNFIVSKRNQCLRLYNLLPKSTLFFVIRNVLNPLDREVVLESRRSVSSSNIMKVVADHVTAAGHLRMRSDSHPSLDSL